MKTPWYETSPGALLALLLTKKFVSVDLYTITLAGGDIYRWSTAMIDVVVPGYFTWSAKGALFEADGKRMALHQRVGTDVDTLEIPLAMRSADPITGASFPDKLGDIPLQQALRGRALDGATIKLDRAFFALWPTAPTQTISPIGVVTLFYGPTGNIDVGRNIATISANSFAVLLTKNVTRDVYQASCPYTLFEPRCGLSQAAYAINGMVSALPAGNQFFSGVAAPGGSGTYTLGRVVMTSGKNKGFARSVRSWIPGAFTLLGPFYFAVAIGDTFMAYPGCNKTQVNCALFGNILNFGGQPYVPAPETAI